MCDNILRLQSENFEISTQDERIDRYVETLRLMLNHHLKKKGELPTYLSIIAKNGPLDVTFQYKMQNDVPRVSTLPEDDDNVR